MALALYVKTKSQLRDLTSACNSLCCLTLARSLSEGLHFAAGQSPEPTRINSHAPGSSLNSMRVNKLIVAIREYLLFLHPKGPSCMTCDREPLARACPNYRAQSLRLLTSRPARRRSASWSLKTWSNGQSSIVPAASTLFTSVTLSVLVDTASSESLVMGTTLPSGLLWIRECDAQSLALLMRQQTEL